MRNFDALPPYVVLLHGHERSHHSGAGTYARAQAVRPADVAVLSATTWRHIHGSSEHMLARLARDGELRALDEVYAYLFGAARFADAFEAWGMLDYRCCAELVVARASVLRVGRARLSRLAARIRADDAARDTSARWSYVMERTWQNLFSKPLAGAASNRTAGEYACAAPCAAWRGAGARPPPSSPVCYDAARTAQCRPVRGCDLSWEVCLPVPD